MAPWMYNMPVFFDKTLWAQNETTVRLCVCTGFKTENLEPKPI